MTRFACTLWSIALVALAWSATGLSCSLQNRDGPAVTCAELDCGRINACQEGIIAQCADGHAVRYHACSSNDDGICEEDWQVAGQYRCTEWHTECEGCDPTGPGCPTTGTVDGGDDASVDGG